MSHTIFGKSAAKPTSSTAMIGSRRSNSSGAHRKKNAAEATAAETSLRRIAFCKLLFTRGIGWGKTPLRHWRVQSPAGPPATKSSQ